MEKRAERLQREKKKKRENQQKYRESLRHKMSNPYGFPEALTRQNVETQPSLEGFCSPIGQSTDLSMVLISKFNCFW